MKNEKHAAIYIRVSTDAQYEEGYSVEAQKEQLAAYCISKGIKNYEFYIDGGWSGSNIERPEMQRLINNVKDGKVSHCLVYKLDRLSRSQKDTLYIIEDVLNPHNVDFISITESLDTSTPVGRLMIGILSAFAQLERENIRMRTRMGMKERVKDGYWMGGGRVPFGYDYDKNKGILVHNKDSDKVKKIYELYIKGYAPQQIANILDLKYDKLVLQIIKRKSNYGVIEYNGEEYQGRHEPIISKDVYDKAMYIMNERSQKYTMSGSEHLLTGLVYCGCCGAKMRYQKWGNKGDKLTCYSQQKSKKYLVKDPNCKQEKVWAKEVEDAVLEKLFLNNFENSSSEKEKNENSNAKSVINMLNESKSEIEKKIRKLYNLYAENDDDLLLETINENKNKLEKINKNIEDEERKLSNNILTKEMKETVINLKNTWEYMTIRQKKHVIQMLVNSITIKNETLEICFNFEVN